MQQRKDPPSRTQGRRRSHFRRQMHTTTDTTWLSVMTRSHLPLNLLPEVAKGFFRCVFSAFLILFSFYFFFVTDAPTYIGFYALSMEGQLPRPLSVGVASPRWVHGCQHRVVSRMQRRGCLPCLPMSRMQGRATVLSRVLRDAPFVKSTPCHRGNCLNKLPRRGD